MSRFEDTPNLFGGGGGISTTGHFHCEMCDNTYNEGIGVDNNEEGGCSVTVGNFAGMEICEDCFEKVEQSVLARMPHILPWYRRYMDSVKERVNEADENLKACDS